MDNASNDKMVPEKDLIAVKKSAESKVKALESRLAELEASLEDARARDREEELESALGGYSGASDVAAMKKDLILGQVSLEKAKKELEKQRKSFEEERVKTSIEALLKTHGVDSEVVEGAKNLQEAELLILRHKAANPVEPVKSQQVDLGVNRTGVTTGPRMTPLEKIAAGLKSGEYQKK